MFALVCEWLLFSKKKMLGYPSKPMAKNTQKAFFLDRDGVINEDYGYISSVDDFEFKDGIFPVLQTLSGKGYALIVVTNQSGIGRGYYSRECFQELTTWMTRKLSEKDIHLTDVYSCPHSPENNCNCRKPAPGMLLRAIREHGISPEHSWMLGDKPSDMSAAAAAGIRQRVLLGNAVSEDCTQTISSLSDLLTLSL